MGELSQDKIARYVRMIESERETLTEMAERVASGETLVAICTGWDIPYGRFAAWLSADGRRSDVYEAARKIRADALADETLKIADDKNDDVDHQLRALRIKARQWVAAKWDRDRYGEALDVRVAVVDVRGALEEARGRLVAVVPQGEADGGGDI